MANLKCYIPKMNDPVLVKGKPYKYGDVVVHAGTKTADVRTPVFPVILYYDLPWSRLSCLVESLCG
jgi:hypothetical protein